MKEKLSLRNEIRETIPHPMKQYPANVLIAKQQQRKINKNKRTQLANLPINVLEKDSKKEN